MSDQPTGRLVLFKGRSSYINLFMEEFRKGFEELGYEVMFFDSNYPGQSITDFTEFAKKPITAALTYNDQEVFIGAEEGQTLWDEFGIPIISILMDHPVFFGMDLRDNPPASLIVLAIDRNHMNFISRFYTKVGIAGFLPHGGMLHEGTLKPVRERSIDIIFAGSAHGNPAGDPKYDEAGNYICTNDLERGVVKALADDNSITLEEAVERAAKELGLEYSDDELFDIISAMGSLQLTLSFQYRERMLRNLVENGVRLTLFGNGWENMSWADNPNLDYRGSVAPPEAAKAMLDAKIVLSTTTWFKDGIHDRVTNGMLAGAAVLSDTSVYTKEVFDDSEIVFFELDEIDSLHEKVKALLADPDKMQAIADKGRQKAERDHTWQARARELHEDLLSQI